MADASSVDFRALQLFIAVYDNQSFSVVARREGVSPSLISRTIQQLEDALGQQLFYRNTRAVVPTEAGRFFAASARELLGQYADAQRALQDRAQVPGGLVRINAPVYFGQRHIAPWLPELAARHPKLQFDLMLTDDFIDPHRDATDILFRISSLPDAGYHARVFGSQRYYLTASPEYVSRYGSPTSPEALHQHRTLVYGGSQGANRWLFRQREEAWVHYPLTPLMTSNNADALLTSAIGGMGIVLFPDWMVSGALHNG
ncbi:LysR family transcriptional regulator, partial [Klebsiella pneumoniae]